MATVAVLRESSHRRVPPFCVGLQADIDLPGLVPERIHGAIHNLHYLFLLHVVVSYQLMVDSFYISLQLYKLCYYF